MILDRRRYGKDNYTYLLAEGADAALVDPGDPVIALGMAAAHGLHPRWILHTHGHADHTSGSAVLRARLGARVLGHGADAARFAPDEDLAGRGEVSLGALRVRVHAAPGHTPGAVLFEVGGSSPDLHRPAGPRTSIAPRSGAREGAERGQGGGALLTGDTLFWGGAGNCRSGGDPAVLARTFLGVLAALPGELRVHPGHDYAEQNLTFVLALEPGNDAARRRLEAARAAHARGEEPEAPTLDEERAANPFLRAGEPGVRDAVARMSGTPPGPSPADVFVALRALRDRG